MLIVKGNRSHNTAAFTTPYNFCQKKCCHSKLHQVKVVRLQMPSLQQLRQVKVVRFQVPNLQQLQVVQVK